MLRIKELRLEKNLTQGDLAQKIGSTSKSIWAYENQVAVPPLDVLSRLADFFGCSLDYLTGRSDDFGNVTVANDAPPLPADAQELVDMFLSLSPAHRIQILEYTKYFTEREAATKKRS